MRKSNIETPWRAAIVRRATQSSANRALFSLFGAAKSATPKPEPKLFKDIVP